MIDLDIDELDKSLEIAVLIRSSEAGYVRDYLRGYAIARDDELRRLDAFTLGLLDALAHRLGARHDTLRLLAYLFALLEHGPGRPARKAFREMFALGSAPGFARYFASGRHHVIQVLQGSPPDVGRFASLLSEEFSST
jgi:hypothetical protein